VKIIIKTKNLELTASLENLINKKMDGLKKFIGILKGKSAEVFVEVEKETKHHRKGDIFKSEAILQLPGKKLVARAHGEDVAKAIVEVKEELEREIRKYKSKMIEIPRRQAQKFKQEV